jgi:Ran GTPase-activating protein 1
MQEEEALHVLRIICAALKASAVKHLNISDNALGEKGVRACQDALTGRVRRPAPPS